jgi:hypothetical protein
MTLFAGSVAKERGLAVDSAFASASDRRIALSYLVAH